MNNVFKKHATLLILTFAFLLNFPRLYAQQDYYQNDIKTNHSIIAEKAKTNDDYKKLLEIAEKYQLLIGIRKFKTGYKAKTQNIKRFQGQYRWNFLSSKDDKVLDQYVKCFVENWEIFPTEFIKKSGLRAIVFVRNLKFANTRVGGGFDVSDSVVFVNLATQFYSKEYALHIVYHEFFHLLQNKFYSPGEFLDYKKWRSLNAPGVKYYPGGAMAMIRKNSKRFSYFFEKPKIKGFVTQYARADFYHDPTELFCYLFIDENYTKLKKWMKTDKYLRQKTEYLIECLNKISPIFSFEYFDAVYQ